MCKREKVVRHEYFMKHALAEAEKALCAGEFPVGCVISVGDSLVATGRRTHSSEECENELDHAEIVALREFSENTEIQNRDTAVLYCTLEPCLMCYAAILLSGIRTVVYAYEDVMGGGTSIDRSALCPLYAAADMLVLPHVMRWESLSLFQRFFKKTDQNYLKGTLLERYTLSQKKEL